MSIDLGNAPVGTPPTSEQNTQMRTALGLAPAEIVAYVNTELGIIEDAPTVAISDPSFTLVKMDRDVNLLPKEFEVLNTRFESVTPFTLSVGATKNATGGLALTKSSGVGNAFCTGSTKLKAPCVSVEIEVDLSTASGAAQYVAAGIALNHISSEQNYIVAYWNKVAGIVGLDLKRAGAQTSVTGSAFAPATRFKMMVTIFGNNVSVMADTGSGYYLVHLFKEALATPWNLRTSWDSNNYVPFLFAFATSGQFVVTSFRAGYAGWTGLQSMCVVKYEDGTPIRDQQGNYYLHATACLPYNETSIVANYWRHAHGVTFKVDPITYAATPCASYVPYRASEFRPDDAFGPIIYDRDAKTWYWLTQNASQLGVVNAKIHNYYTKQNLLQGMHVISDSHEITVTGNIRPIWDADVIKVPVEGGHEWYLSYTARTADLLAGTFYPALAKSTAADLTTAFTFVAHDNTQTTAEGTHFGKIGGTWYVLSSNNSGLLAYNFSMVLQRTVTPTGFTLGGAPHPHFNLIALSVGDKTKYVIDTFDRTLGVGAGNGTYGNRTVYESGLYAGSEHSVDALKFV